MAADMNVASNHCDIKGDERCEIGGRYIPKSCIKGDSDIMMHLKCF